MNKFLPFTFCHCIIHFYFFNIYHPKENFHFNFHFHLGCLWHILPACKQSSQNTPGCGPKVKKSSWWWKTKSCTKFSLRRTRWLPTLSKYKYCQIAKSGHGCPIVKYIDVETCSPRAAPTKVVMPAFIASWLCGCKGHKCVVCWLLRSKWYVVNYYVKVIDYGDLKTFWPPSSSVVVLLAPRGVTINRSTMLSTKPLFWNYN